MTKQIKLAEAILSLNPSAIFSHEGDNIIWYDGTTQSLTPPIELTWTAVKAEMDKL